ncbi:MAG: signal peptidase I [Eubacteriales bacterium]|nr:signal peptidase I [Eubacteriales bacterium]
MDKKYIKELKEWVKDIIIAVIVAVIILQFIKPTFVKETSMLPTLQEYNFLFLSKQSYFFGEPERGDIIVFHTDLKTQNGDKKMLIKRVIGLPGENIHIEDGQVIIDGGVLEETYTMEPYTSGYVDTMKIPDDSLFVMGDNRQNSIDSRDASIGLVKIKDVYGKAVFRLYPFNKIGLLDKLAEL